MADDRTAAETAADEQAATDLTIPASGGDRDSRKRTLKTVLAMAETSGDTDTADAVREELAAMNEETAAAAQAAEHETAAANRREAAAGPGASTSPPQGRAAPAKATTVAKSK